MRSGELRRGLRSGSPVSQAAQGSRPAATGTGLRHHDQSLRGRRSPCSPRRPLRPRPLGAVPGYASAAGARWDAVTFFAGSLFFTAAGFLTYREAVDAGPRTPGSARRHFFVFEPCRIDWWATAVQLAGTLFFNVSTRNALRVDLTAQAAHQHVWRPDAFGSVCFLIASALAWFETCRGWAAWRPRSWSWWITLLNLTGSVAFGVSAVAGYINPSTGQMHNAELTNLGTFIGALCFLAGALLLLPERTEETSPALTAPAASGT